MTLTRIGLIVCLSVLGVACSKASPDSGAKSEQPNSDSVQRISSLDVVRATADPTSIGAGDSGEVKVHLKIQQGYHINANPPSFRYLRATELTVGTTGGGVSALGVTYPKGLSRKFGFSETPIDVYEDEAVLKVKLQVDKGAFKGERSIPAMIEIQACDDQVCYAPAIMNLMLMLTIK